MSALWLIAVGLVSLRLGYVSGRRSVRDGEYDMLEAFVRQAGETERAMILKEVERQTKAMAASQRRKVGGRAAK